MQASMKTGPKAAEEKAQNSAPRDGTLSFRTIVSTLIRRIRAALLRFKDCSTSLAKAARTLSSVKCREAAESKRYRKPRTKPLTERTLKSSKAPKMPKATRKNEASEKQMNANVYTRALTDKLAKRKFVNRPVRTRQIFS